MEKLANFDRERIPERVVHARGAAAKGFFEVRARLAAFSPRLPSIAPCGMHAMCHVLGGMGCAMGC